MDDPQNTPMTFTDRSGVTDAVRTQILATEHWSLLATRSMTWNEVFSRATMFITVLSAAVVALALVAQATSFGTAFHIFALLVLPIVLLVGVATIIRLGAANTEDLALVIGMNRLRHAYLQLAPELEPYFVTGATDDDAGVMQTFGIRRGLSASRILAGTPTFIGAINVVVAGVLAALIAETLGVDDTTATAVGVVAGLVACVCLAALAYYTISGARLSHRPRFPR